MANEPERDIEKQLRAGAKLRRNAAGPPRAMPAATRQCLQAEIARAQSRKESHSSFWSQLFGVSWPRFALAAAGVVLLGILGVHFLSSSRRTFGVATFAFNESSPRANLEMGTTAEKTPRPVAAPSVAKELPANAPPASPAPATVAASDADKTDVNRTRALSGAKDFKKIEPQVRRETAMSTNQVLAFASAAPVVSRDDRKPISAAPAGAIIQSYARVNPSDALKLQHGSASTIVLNSFRLEQSSNQIRVIDSDGSVYSGSVKTNHAQNFSFQLRGTNRTLNQLIVFTGQLEHGTSQSAISTSPLPAGASQKLTGAVQRPVLKTRITGRAIIGKTNELDIVAESTAP